MLLAKAGDKIKLLARQTFGIYDFLKCRRFGTLPIFESVQISQLSYFLLRRLWQP